MLSLVHRLKQTPQSFQAPYQDVTGEEDLLWWYSTPCQEWASLVPSALIFHIISAACHISVPAGIPALRQCRASVDCLNLAIPGEKSSCFLSWNLIWNFRGKLKSWSSNWSSYLKVPAWPSLVVLCFLYFIPHCFLLPARTTPLS